MNILTTIMKIQNAKIVGFNIQRSTKKHIMAKIGNKLDKIL